MLKFLLVVAMIAGLVYALMWTIERRRAAEAGGSAPKKRREQRRPTK